MIRACRPFPLGQIVATPGALAAFQNTGESPQDFLRRHAGGDWGTVGPEDWKANDDSLRDGLRLLSAYRLKDGTALWVITESDRSATTILLPEDY